MIRTCGYHVRLYMKAIEEGWICLLPDFKLVNKLTQL